MRAGTHDGSWRTVYAAVLGYMPSRLSRDIAKLHFLREDLDYDGLPRCRSSRSRCQVRSMIFSTE